MVDNNARLVLALRQMTSKLGKDLPKLEVKSIDPNSSVNDKLLELANNQLALTVFVVDLLQKIESHLSVDKR